MAKLYFRYGAMGSSKTANALMVDYNYKERGKTSCLVKPKIDSRDGDKIVRSRIGLESECEYLEELVRLSDDELKKYDCIIVDDLGIPVICYGLRADFQNELFEGSKWLLAWADKIEEIKTVCWCGSGARCNARVNEKGEIVRVGEQVVLGANDKYISLCRKHFNLGMVKPQD